MHSFESNQPQRITVTNNKTEVVTQTLFAENYGKFNRVIHYDDTILFNYTKRRIFASPVAYCTKDDHWVNTGDTWQATREVCKKHNAFIFKGDICLSMACALSIISPSRPFIKPLGDARSHFIFYENVDKPSFNKDK